MNMINVDLNELVRSYPILNKDWYIVNGKNCLIEKISKIVRMNINDMDETNVSRLHDIAKDCRGIYIGINWYFYRKLPQGFRKIDSDSDPWSRPFPNYRSGLKSHGNIEINFVDSHGKPIKEIATVHTTTVMSNRVYCVDLYTQ